MRRNPNNFFNKGFILPLGFLLLFHISLWGQQSSSPSLSTTTSGLKNEILTFLSKGKITEALDKYDDMYTNTFKEDYPLLEKICLKVFEINILEGQSETRYKVIKKLKQFLGIKTARILIQALGDPVDLIREEAIKVLSTYNNDVLYPEISGLLLDPVQTRKIESGLKIIGNIKVKSFLPQVMPFLKNDDPVFQALAVDAIAAMDPSEEVQETLNEMLKKSHSERVRSAVIKAFITLDSDRLDVKPLMREQSPAVRLALLDWAKEVPGAQADRIIKNELHSKNMELYTAACLAAYESEKLSDRVDWEKLADHPQEKLRLIALKALIKGEALDEQEMILKFLNDISKAVRSHAAKHILTVDSYFTELLLDEILTAGSDLAKDAILGVWTPENSGRLPLEKFRDIYTSNHASLLEAAIPLLKYFSSEEKSSIIERLSQSNKVSVRRKLYEYLSLEEAALWHQFKDKGLSDSAVSVRAEALRGLTYLDSTQWKAITEKWKKSHFYLERSKLVESYTRCKDDEKKLEIVKQFFEDKHPVVRLEVLKLVSTVSDDESIVKYLTDFLFDSDERVRRYALKMIENPKGKGSKEEKKDSKEKDKKKQGKDTKGDEKEGKGEKGLVKGKKTEESAKKNRILSWLKATQSKVDTAATDFKKKEKVNTELMKGAIIKKKSSQGELKQKLTKLMKQNSGTISERAEDWLLQMGDEKSLEKVKNRLESGSKEERKKAAEKLGLLSDENTVSLLREQLKDEEDQQVQIEIVTALWKVLGSYL